MKDEFIRIKLPRDFNFWIASWPMRMNYILQQLIKMDEERKEKNLNKEIVRREYGI